MKKWILIIVGALVGLVAIVCLVGMMVPEHHTATRRARYEQPQEAIWDAITDFPGTADWRSAVNSMERLPDRNGRQVWRESGVFGPMTYEIEEFVPPTRLVMRIADPELPFGGRWIYEIAPTNDGCTLTITEDGEVYNPIFRFMSRFVFGYTATMEEYLRDLGAKFGEEAHPEPVEQ